MMLFMRIPILLYFAIHRILLADVMQDLQRLTFWQTGLLLLLMRILSWNTVSVRASIPILLLLIWPPLHLLFMRQGLRPSTAAIDSRLPGFREKRWPRLVAITERLAVSCIHRQPPMLLFAFGFSLLSSAVMAEEYMLKLRFLGVLLPIEATLAASTFSMLAFIPPLAGGWGIGGISGVCNEGP